MRQPTIAIQMTGDGHSRCSSHATSGREDRCGRDEEASIGDRRAGKRSLLGNHAAGEEQADEGEELQGWAARPLARNALLAEQRQDDQQTDEAAKSHGREGSEIVENRLLADIAEAPEGRSEQQ